MLGVAMNDPTRPTKDYGAMSRQELRMDLEQYDFVSCVCHLTASAPLVRADTFRTGYVESVRRSCRESVIVHILI